MLSFVATASRKASYRIGTSSQSQYHQLGKTVNAQKLIVRASKSRRLAMEQRNYSSSSDYLNTITTIDCNYMERPDYASAYLVTNGKHAAFIDNNTYQCVPSLMKALEDQGLAPENVDYIIITHVHLDHAGATGVLAELCPNATVLAHPVRGSLFSYLNCSFQILTLILYHFIRFRELLVMLLIRQGSNKVRDKFTEMRPSMLSTAASSRFLRVRFFHLCLCTYFIAL